MLTKTRIGVALIGALGVGITASLATYAGLGAVAGALDDVGWLGITWVCVLQLVSLGMCAAAWQLVADGASFVACFTARSIRDGVSNLAGIIPTVGEVAGARSLSLLGATAGVAAASTVVDVAIESLAQALYTIVGLIPILLLVERDEITRWLTMVVVALAPILAAVMVTRRRGALQAAERIIIQIGRALGLIDADANLEVAHRVFDIYQRRRHICLAMLLHLGGWLMGTVQIWAAAQALDRPLSIGEALALESLAYAARGAFFFVPWGAGVQEGTFLLVGTVLGVDPASAIALSLVLRARDIVFGLPAVAVWYTAEVRRQLLKHARVQRRR